MKGRGSLASGQVTPVRSMWDTKTQTRRLSLLRWQLRQAALLLRQQRRLPALQLRQAILW